MLKPFFPILFKHNLLANIDKFFFFKKKKLSSKMIFFFFLKLEHSFIYNRRESWYNAFKAGGGESSIQNTSSKIFLACCARAWTTRLPPLLIQLKFTQCIPQTKWHTSSTTLPKSDWLAEEEDKAFITLLLSPSITSSENLASVANSTAFLHANNSASSLLLTGGPPVDITAITSPLSFRIMAPTPLHQSLIWRPNLEVVSTHHQLNAPHHQHANFLENSDIPPSTPQLSCTTCWDLESSLHAAICFVGSKVSMPELKTTPSLTKKVYSTNTLSALSYQLGHAYTSVASTNSQPTHPQQLRSPIIHVPLTLETWCNSDMHHHE